jgi:hypothetical protein
MSRAEWILGGILVVLLAVVVIAAALLWLPDSSPEGPIGTLAVTVPVGPPLADEGDTAVLAFAAANETAQNWQPDAQLVEATATWPQGITQDDIATGTSIWDFTFYSPAANQIATINQVGNELPKLITQFPAQNVVTPLSTTAWQIDSAEAISILLEQAGGAEFLRSQGVSILTMSLNTVTESSRIEWFISLFSSQTGQSLTIRVDANSGELIPNTPT